MGNTKLANPAPLGLMGFGMTTILLNLHNVGYFALDGIILAMGIFYGGIAQIFAGLLEYKKGNTFGLTAFTSYGSFWLTLVAILLMPKLGLTDAPNAQFLGVYLGLWGIFTLFMFFGTLKGARVLQFVFFSLTVLFACWRSVTLPVTPRSSTLPAGLVLSAVPVQSIWRWVKC